MSTTTAKVAIELSHQVEGAIRGGNGGKMKGRELREDSVRKGEDSNEEGENAGTGEKRRR